MAMRTRNSKGFFSLRQMAELVAEQLPGHTMNHYGRVVETVVCPLCKQSIIDQRQTRTIIQNRGHRVVVHRRCPGEGDL